MHPIFALVVARNKEFYRDRAALVWSICFPLLLILGFSLAFARPEPAVFQLGLVDEAAPAALPEYVATVDYVDRERALARLRHHELDLLLDGGAGRLYYNALSPASLALLDLLDGGDPLGLETQAVTGEAVRYADWVIPGVVGMNLMFGALFGVGFVIVRYRKNGVLRRLAASPISPLVFLTSQMLSRFIIVMAVNSAILISCTLLLGLRMEGSWLSLLLTLGVGSLTMICVGLVVASRIASEELANGLLDTLSLLMMFFSELWFSLDSAPRWMQWLSELLPLTHMVRALRAIMVEGAGLADIWSSLAALGLFAVFSLALAARLFRWEADG
ncbi:MAG: ABC transporter permease [Cellvibrionales bacterium]|nr:ABC transporter permease [Cellvibrionales bacterium]